MPAHSLLHRAPVLADWRFCFGNPIGVADWVLALCNAWHRVAMPLTHRTVCWPRGQLGRVARCLLDVLSVDVGRVVDRHHAKRTLRRTPEHGVAMNPQAFCCRGRTDPLALVQGFRSFAWHGFFCAKWCAQCARFLRVQQSAPVRNDLSSLAIVAISEQEAREVLAAEADRVSVRILSSRIGLKTHTVLARFLNGSSLKGKNREILLVFAEEIRNNSQPSVLRETAPTYGADAPLTPVQRVHAAGADYQRQWLWDYTVSVMRAIVEQADLLGASPPKNSPAEFAARAGTQAMQYLMTTASPAPAPPDVNVAHMVDPSGKGLPLGKARTVSTAAAKKAKRRHA